MPSNAFLCIDFVFPLISLQNLVAFYGKQAYVRYFIMTCHSIFVKALVHIIIFYFEVRLLPWTVTFVFLMLYRRRASAGLSTLLKKLALFYWNSRILWSACLNRHTAVKTLRLLRPVCLTFCASVVQGSNAYYPAKSWTSWGGRVPKSHPIRWALKFNLNKHEV